MNERDHRNIKVKRTRGTVIFILYSASSLHLDFSTLKYCLDKRGITLTTQRLGRELEFLRDQRLIEILEVGGKRELTEPEARRILQNYSESFGEMDDILTLTLTSRGTNFQEEDLDLPGIIRIN